MYSMKDSGVEWIGDIPDAWDVTILSALFGERKQKNIGLIEPNLLSLSYGNIKRKNIDTNEGLLPASFETYNIVEQGDIVFRLTDLQNDKRSLRTGLCKERGIITSAYVTLYRKAEDDPAYMHYLFHAYDICKVFYGMGDGVRQGMNYDDLKSLRVIRPPVDVQKRIADYLDAKCAKIDALIAKQQEIIEKLKAYKLSVITEAVTKGLNPTVPMKDSGYSFIGDIPKAWLPTKLKHITLAIGDGIHATPDYDEGGEYFFLNGNSIGQDQLVFKENTDKLNEVEFRKHKSPLLTDDTILITLNGATYGKTSFYHGEKVLLGKSAGYITLKSGVSRQYVRYYLQSRVAKIIMELSLCGSTIANLSLSTLNNFFIPLPTIEEQKEITDYLNQECHRLDSIIGNREQMICKLTEDKKSLIYEVVTGKREVNT